MSERRVRYGMVGGGPGAFIGEVHRMAAALDGESELVAGAFSSNPDRSRQKGRELGLDRGRVYLDYREMAEREAALPAHQRIEYVSIVTPNHLHFDIARTFLEAGFHVVCDKPLTTKLEDAEALCRLVAERGAVFVLTHNYRGYPMIREARSLVREGRLGEIRKIVVEYLQGWLSSPLEDTGNRQASWRTDPERAGSGALGDIGTHAYDLAAYVTGLDVEAVCADLTSFVPNRRVEDDASVLVRWTEGAKGTLIASQIATGEENELGLRIYGEEASLAWRQADPETLVLRDEDGTIELLRRGHENLSEASRAETRLPPGHPEGFIPGFANLYRGAAGIISARAAGEEASLAWLPTVWDGARGVHFIQRTIESASSGGWVDARYEPPAEPRA